MDEFLLRNLGEFGVCIIAGVPLGYLEKAYKDRSNFLKTLDNSKISKIILSGAVNGFADILETEIDYFSGESYNAVNLLKEHAQGDIGGFFGILAGIKIGELIYEKIRRD